MSFLQKSPWIIHYDATSCNGCDIEVLACLTPRFDVERLGVMNTGNPKHADIFLITGSINHQSVEVVKNIYSQMPEPKVVVAVGICATSGGIFSECYNVLGGVDKVLPVDVYVPGCAARPEAIIDGVLKAVEVLEKRRLEQKWIHQPANEAQISIALPEDALEILDLQKTALKSEAEMYQDPRIFGLFQSIAEIEKDLATKQVFKALLGSRIVGTIRGYMLDETCFIERLIVDPYFQERKVGSQLMNAIEKAFPAAKRFETCTGHKSQRHLKFLSKRGFEPIRTERVNRHIWIVTLEKRVNGTVNRPGETHD